MAATYFGFQFFVVHLHRGTTRPPQDFTTARLGNRGPTLAEALAELRPSIEGRTRTGDLKYREHGTTDDEPATDDAPGKTKPAIRVLSLGQTHERRVDFEFRYGRAGAHDFAIAENAAEDAHLKGKASTNVFRAFLYLPTGGSSALLVVENRAGTCPADYLLKHLSFAFKEQDDLLPEAERRGWWRLMAQGATDTSRLDEVLRHGRGASLQLQRHSATNGRRRENVITLRQDGLQAGKLSEVRRLAYAWLGRTDPDRDETDERKAPEGTAVQQIAALLDVHVTSDDFNDGALVYDDGNGRTKTIRPGSIKDVFIYPVSVGRVPTATEIREAAEPRVPALATLLQIAVEL